jgi:hypothetical protein
MSKHRYLGHKWNHLTGRMEFESYEFDSLEEARSFAGGATHERFKIYDENNQVVHSGSNTPVNTYA